MLKNSGIINNQPVKISTTGQKINYQHFSRYYFFIFQIIIIRIQMNIDFYEKDELELQFVDQQRIHKLEKSLINTYIPLEDISINFHDMFDLDQSEYPQSKSGKFFSSKNIKVEKESRPQLTVYLQQNLGNLKARRKTLYSLPISLLKTIENIFIPANRQEYIDLFMKSDYFLNFIRLIVCLNLIGILIINYSFRIGHERPVLCLTNIISLNLQLFSNCVFTLQIFLRLYQSENYITNPYVIINLIGTISCWTTIFFDMVENDQAALFKFFMVIRIVRAVIRILEVFQFLKTPFEIFINTIPSLKKLFFPLIILMMFYAITGMALFSGIDHYRCQSIESHQVIYHKFCGSALFSCGEGEICAFLEHISDEELKISHNQFGLVNFDNIVNALLTVYHFIYNANFSEIRDKFASFINPYITSVYFVSSSLIFFYIFSNLIMVSMSKAYVEQVEGKIQKEKKEQEEPQVEVQLSCFAKIVSYINIIVLIMQSIVVCLVYSNMEMDLVNKRQQIDFALIWVAFFIMTIKMMIEGKRYLKNVFNILDIIVMLFNFINLIYCAVNSQDIIYSISNVSLVIKSIKILRIIQLLYINKNIFSYEKFVIELFLRTLYKIKSFILLCFCFVIMFQQLGQLFFAFLVRVNNSLPHSHQIPYINNFESFSSSLFNIIYLFFNESWSFTMYNYYNAVGIEAVFFFIIVIFIAYLMLMRLYIAVFLSYFKQQLKYKSKDEVVHEKSVKSDNEVQPSKKREIIEDIQFSRCQSIQVQKQKRQAHFIRTFLNTIYHSQKFYYLINAAIYIHSLSILVRSSSDNPDKTAILNAIESICFIFYTLEVIIGCLAHEILGFLQLSKSSVISFLTIFVMVASLIPYNNLIINNTLRRVVIIKIFTLFRQTNKEMTIILDTIFQICKKFFNFVLIYIFFLVVISVVPLRIFYNNNPFNICQLPHQASFQSSLESHQQCIQLGGSWIPQQQRFDNIFTSLALMYQLISTQQWTKYLQVLWKDNQNVNWQIYFTLTFFIYNICFLNIFLGFIVQNYLHLKDKAYNLDMLKRSQKGWILIKNRINCLFPKSSFSISPESSQKRKFFYKIIMNQTYETTMNYSAYVNAFLYMISYTEQSGLYSSALTFFKNIFIGVFFIDAWLKLFVLRKIYFELDNSLIQFVGSIYIMIYWSYSIFFSLSHEQSNILQFFLVVFLLFRCKSLLLKYSWCKTNLNSVIDILPKCGNIIKLVGVVLFFYASLGMEIFKYRKPDNIADNYNMGFNDFLVSILTLVRISISESWNTVISQFIKKSNQNYVCYDIGNYSDVEQYGNNGCGTLFAYPFFLCFHITMVLLVLNLLVATMASAYDDNYQIQYNSVNIFQLEDCLNLWQKYDPEGMGVVQYKKFWRLTSEIAILFGISKKKLIKRKNKFFEQLDLQIYQQKSNPILCYRFHDVITKFSKIKLQIAHLGNDDEINDNKKNEVEISFDISPLVLKEIKDYIIPFPDQYYSNYKPFKSNKSGETKYIFGLLKKLRQWKHLSTEKKRMIGGTKLSSMFDLKSKKVVYPSQRERDTA